MVPRFGNATGSVSSDIYLTSLSLACSLNKMEMVGIELERFRLYDGCWQQLLIASDATLRSQYWYANDVPRVTYFPIPIVLSDYPGVIR